MNRKTLAMLIFMLLGFVFIYIAVNVSSLGFLATIGAWILVGLLYYDYRRAQRKWEQKHTQR